ncbi:nitrogen fixation protein NifU-related proteins [Halalkaliarchaeum desulfuricum]|uniref:Nitrogen fixation protein NifU-related proteins n=1 Tax=Halalkaliarchaeum desulfuricum TaxID=2055893 RepID=A0A343TM05_9EURY|nr:iron-sulfur cluster assembly scaffold protein [Halalkaliarchaeum desulfuricum]AUX10127.1 nitrogen fixation protein NifU-related proteins [Halalkaliarchaeum desulfuricum]
MCTPAEIYRERLLDHNENPRNAGRLPDPDRSLEEENPNCGDTLRFDIALTDDGDSIDDIRFESDSCAITRASASMLTEELQGEPVQRAFEIDREEMIEDILQVEISPMRRRCALFPRQVAQRALEE